MAWKNDKKIKMSLPPRFEPTSTPPPPR